MSLYLPVAGIAIEFCRRLHEGYTRASFPTIVSYRVSPSSQILNEFRSFISFIGIAYQLPGSVAGERALLITEHMKAMGLLDSARILCVSLAYDVL